MESIETELCEDASKRDDRGRRIADEQERERLMVEYDRSGLTQKGFCRREGINYHTFVAWLGKRRRDDSSRQLAGPGFRELVFTGGGVNKDSLEVRLPTGEVIGGSDVEAVAKLVELLRG